MITNEFVLKTDNVSEAINKFNYSSKQLDDSLAKLSKQGIGSLLKSLDDVVLGSKSAGDAMRSMLKSVLNSVINQVANEVGNIGSSSTSSGIFDSIGSILGNIGFRAEGGIVAPNSAFIVGEKGPELLVTGNSSGQVINNSALSNTSTGNVQVNVNNYSKSEVSVSQQTNANGESNIEITIDDMVANAISSPASKTGKVLKNIYGVDPVLLRR